MGFILPNALQGQSIWTGSGDGVNWTDPDNWSTGVPDQIGNAEIPNGMTAVIALGNTVTWTTGNLTGGGILLNRGVIELNTPFNKTINENATINNEHIIDINDGDLFLGDGTLTNNGTINFTGDNDDIRISTGSTHDLINNGTIAKIGGSSISLINVEFINSGTIHAVSGELRLQGESLYKNDTELLSDQGAISVSYTHLTLPTILRV